jgi:hypothetical protein
LNLEKKNSGWPPLSGVDEHALPQFVSASVTIFVNVRSRKGALSRAGRAGVGKCCAVRVAGFTALELAPHGLQPKAGFRHRRLAPARSSLTITFKKKRCHAICCEERHRLRRASGEGSRR